ncbi:unnamed protein product, partial [Phaeothamnion confervicola]
SADFPPVVPPPSAVAPVPPAAPSGSIAAPLGQVAIEAAPSIPSDSEDFSEPECALGRLGDEEERLVARLNAAAEALPPPFLPYRPAATTTTQGTKAKKAAESLRRGPSTVGASRHG